MQVVEQELARIPRQLGSLVNQQLWSIMYMPQVIPQTGAVVMSAFAVLYVK